MLQVTGKYGTATIMIDAIDKTTLEQVQTYMDNPVAEGCTVVIQPDCHAGAGCVIGFTATLGDLIVPNVVGVDIGCGVRGWCLGQWTRVPDALLASLDQFIRNEIPSGFAVRDKIAPSLYQSDPYTNKLGDACTRVGSDFARAVRSIGTLGGGNHFIELSIDEQACLWLLVHTGSRKFGLDVAKYHQGQAGSGELAALETHSSAGQAYLRDMGIAQGFAARNREAIGHTIINQFFGCLVDRAVESVHNYIADGYVRKGAISAHRDEPVVIPWNMRDGAIIGVGLGNPAWNFSAPHGAGRTLARKQAKRELTMDTFAADMAGIWTTSVSSDTLDESPRAYKDYHEIDEAIAPTVQVVHRLKVLYNFKAN